MPVAAIQPNTILRATEWLVALATGPLATSVAAIAIAFVGFAMLTGRINWRRGGITIAGCFILFGAPAIAQALIGLSATGPSEIVVAGKYNPAPPPAPPAPDAQDPYSGASIIR